MRRAYDGFEGRLHFFAGELGPVEAQKPVVLLDFLDSFEEADAVFGFSDEELVDEVDALPGEVEFRVGDFEGRDLRLVLGDVLAYFVARPAVVRPLLRRAYLLHDDFVENDADRVEVGVVGVGLFQQDFGRHVAGRAAGVFAVAVAEVARDAEVGDVQVAVGAEDEVLGFDVSVEDLHVVDVLEALEDAGDEELGFGFAEGALAEVVAEVSALEVVEHEVEVVAVLEGALDVDEEAAEAWLLVVEFLEDHALVLDRADALLVEDPA